MCVNERRAVGTMLFVLGREGDNQASPERARSWLGGCPQLRWVHFRDNI